MFCSIQTFKLSQSDLLLIQFFVFISVQELFIIHLWLPHISCRIGQFWTLKPDCHVGFICSFFLNCLEDFEPRSLSHFVPGNIGFGDKLRSESLEWTIHRDCSSLHRPSNRRSPSAMCLVISFWSANRWMQPYTVTLICLHQPQNSLD